MISSDYDSNNLISSLSTRYNVISDDADTIDDTGNSILADWAKPVSVVFLFFTNYKLIREKEKSIDCDK